MISDLIKRLFGGRGHLEAIENPKISADERAEIEALKESFTAMAKPAVALTIDHENPVRADAHSSIGGAPSLPSSDDWPQAIDRPMLFLAQINYAEMPPIPGYPTSGLLTIFVADEDIFGCGFPSRDQTNFVTRYYEDPNALVRVPLPAEPTIDMYSDALRQKGAPLTGAETSALPTGVLMGIEKQIRNLSDNGGEEVWDWLAATKPGEVYYGGYPDFVQYDIRAEGDSETEVLLQQGYFRASNSRDWEFCWGDAGEATFLIAPNELAKRNFEAAIYNWDCS